MSLETLKWVTQASLMRSVGGKGVGWTFCMMKDGVPVVEVYGGYARAPWEAVSPALPVTAETRMQIASMSKAITAVGMLLVIEEWNRVVGISRQMRTTLGGIITPAAVAGAAERPLPFVERVLRTNAEIGTNTTVVSLLQTRLAGAPLGNRIAEITIGHLLKHESHIDETLVGDPTPCTWNASFDLWGCVRRRLSRDTLAVPGSSSSYNNVGYDILRAVLEECVQEDYSAYLKRRMFDPVGCRTISCTNDALPTLHYPYPISDAVTPAAGPRPGTPYYDFRPFAGSGGWYSSTRELCQWLSALRRGRVLSPAMTERVFAEGLVFAKGASPGAAPHYLKNGGIGEVNGCLGLFPEGVAAAFITNTGGLNGELIFTDAMEAALPVIDAPAPAQYRPPQVTITNPLGLEDLRITLDGTRPMRTSRRYAGPIVIEADTTVTAALFEAQYTPPPPIRPDDGGLLAGPVMMAAVFDPSTSLKPPVVVTSPLAGGLVRSYFPGPDGAPWTKLPDFSGTAATVSLVPKIELTALPRLTNYALKFDGYIRIETPGVYTFTVASDDGTRLWVGGLLLVDNDGVHDPVPVSAGIVLDTGLHEFLLHYFQGLGNFALSVKWKGPGIPEGPIPPAVLSHKA